MPRYSTVPFFTGNLPVVSVFDAPSSPASARFHGSLPPRMKVLYVTTAERTGGWLAEAFAADSASVVLLEEVLGVTAGIARLRDEVFDAVLVSHEPGHLDALEMIKGLRAGGSEDPMIVLGDLPQHEVDALAYEVGADAYCSVNDATTRSLIWMVARAVERSNLIRENCNLVQSETQRLRHEQHEAQRLLAQQKSLVDQPADDSEPPDATQPAAALLPERLVTHYREMLRAYIIMGAGNLSDEMAAFCELLVSAGVTAQRAMQLHLHVLEESIAGLGNRSARHVMNRADLLALEMMLNLTERYRTHYLNQATPKRQMFLSGFNQESPTSSLQ